MSRRAPNTPVRPAHGSRGRRRPPPDARLACPSAPSDPRSSPPFPHLPSEGAGRPAPSPRAKSAVCAGRVSCATSGLRSLHVLTCPHGGSFSAPRAPGQERVTDRLSAAPGSGPSRRCRSEYSSPRVVSKKEINTTCYTICPARGAPAQIQPQRRARWRGQRPLCGRRRPGLVPNAAPSARRTLRDSRPSW